MITTTLNRIRAYSPCRERWTKLLSHLGKTQGDDEPLPYSTIVESNGLDDALWCCRAEPQYAREWRLFAVWCARQVQHLMSDERSIKALDIAELLAKGTVYTALAASDAAWDAAWEATSDAAWAATRDAASDAARAAAWNAAWATWDAAWATWAVASDVTRAAASNAARAASNAARAASDAAREAQKQQFLIVVGG